MSSFTEVNETASVNAISIAVVGPDDGRRNAVASALGGSEEPNTLDPEQSGVVLTIQEFLSYPLELNDLPQILAQHFDVVFVDLDGDTDYALDVVEGLSRWSSATVMVYSARANRDLVIRCIRAGAREFLNLPLAPGDMAGALARVPIRDPSLSRIQSAAGKLFVFLGAKGGCGVTTVATGFALSLAQASGQRTLLIDFGLPLGDAALQLGMLCDYSTQNALEDWRRLDGSFLRSLLAEHVSGLSVLAAPGEFPKSRAPLQAIDKLMTVARQNFHYVVVDAGSRLDLMHSSLFGDSTYLYLVTQAGISELRNANRLIAQFFSTRGHKLQVVLNRHMPHAKGFDDEQVAKTRPAQWKVLEEDATDGATQHPAISLAHDDSPAAKSIRQMARAACGLPPLAERRKNFRLFR